MTKNNMTPLYTFFSCLFTACILISNVTGVKMIQVGPWALTAGVLIFPVSYIINDVIAEVYGFKAARRLIWTGFGMNLLMVIVFQLAILIPAPEWYDGTAFASVLSNTPRLLFAGLIAYVIGSWINAVVISKMKVKTEGRGFGLRAIISTLLGELVDSCIYIPLAFIGNIPLEAIPEMICLQVAFKTLYEAIVLPLTHIIVKKVKAYEGIDVYDQNESYKIIGR